MTETVNPLLAGLPEADPIPALTEATRIEMAVEHLLLPTGASLGDPDVRGFEVRVRWRGEHRGRSGGGWSVEHRGAELSRAGSWDFAVPKFRRWQYRFDTQAAALEAARAVVDEVTCLGMNWAQFQQHRTGLAAADH